MLVHLIADYGHGDLAFAEVVQRIKRHLPDAEIMLTPVPPFSTLAAGFCVAQLGLNDVPAGTLIFHNVAPRMDDKRPRAGNAGERLAFARLITGVGVVGVNAGYSFSFVREASEELRWVSVPSEGSQFRSRDLFPLAIAEIVRGRAGILAERIASEQVPEIPKSRIAYIDGYGNLKTTLDRDTLPFPSGASIDVRIGKVARKATAASASFEVPMGEMALASGSSGWREASGKERRWMELFLRGGSAWEAFGRPPVGASIKIDFSPPAQARKQSLH